MEGEVARPAVSRENAPVKRQRRTVGRHWKFLAEASALFDASLDYETTLASVVRRAVPTIADYAAIALLAEDGSARWGYSAHRHASKAALAEQLRDYPPVLAGAADPLHRVLQGEETQLISVLDPSRLELGHRAALAVDHAILYRAAEEARRAREAMVAVVSHDLKNPLGTVQMATSLLLDDVIPDDEAHRVARRHLEIIRRASARMFRLIHDLLDASALDEGRLRLERVPLRVHALTEDALDALRPLAAAKQVELTVDVPSELPRIVVDRERLLQVFSNLGGNAIKFAPTGGRVTIGIAHHADAESALEFSVSDTGPGIAPDDLPRIFEPYWRAKRVAREGTGLGLTIAKGIVEAHGGRIDATSVPGQGATFRFTIPIADTE